MSGGPATNPLSSPTCRSSIVVGDVVGWRLPKDLSRQLGRGTNLSNMGWADGNFNCDNIINATDLAILAQDFGYAIPADAVPEPTALLVLVAGVVLLRRRR